MIYNNAKDMFQDMKTHVESSGDSIIKADNPKRLHFGFITVSKDNSELETNRWEIYITNVPTALDIEKSDPELWNWIKNCEPVQTSLGRFVATLKKL